MVFIKRQIVPRSVAVARTYNGINSIKSVTIHQTGNTNRGANAQAHANIQSRFNPRQASWHYSVDDKEIIQSFEDTAQCFHAGDGRGPGNLSSVSIEICINSDGDYSKAVQNAAELTKHLIDKYGLSIKDVKQHYDWSRKNCPAQIRAGKNGITWTKFLDMVANNAPESPIKSKPAPSSKVKSSASSSISKSISQMADEVEAGIHGNGHENRRKSLGISSSDYAKVRAEVNRRSGSPTPKAKAKSSPKPTLKNSSLPNATYYVKNPMFNGSGVRAVQTALASVFFYPDKKAKNNGIDGWYGAKTADAVRRFQLMHGLEADGVYGPKTKVALERVRK